MSKRRSDETQRVADWLKALSNPHRLEILTRMVASCCRGTTKCNAEEVRTHVGELARNLGVGASTASHHIKELRQAGLIRVQRRGKNMECCLDETALAELARFFSALVPSDRAAGDEPPPYGKRSTR